MAIVVEEAVLAETIKDEDVADGEEDEDAGGAEGGDGAACAAGGAMRWRWHVGRSSVSAVVALIGIAAVLARPPAMASLCLFATRSR